VRSIGFSLLNTRLLPPCLETSWLASHPQTYVQLEKTLRTAGEDSDANAVYLRRRAAERRRQWERREVGPWLFSWIYKTLANYGVKPYRLIGYSVGVVALGTWVFLQPHSVSPKPSGLSPTTTQDIRLGVYDAFAVSVHQFLPIDVAMGQEWTPSNRQMNFRLGHRELSTSIPFSAAATILRVIGWVLLPAGIAALTGLFRRTP
jgi:hypothetical protein